MNIQSLTKFTAAIELASAAHQSQVRKGNGMPYISHPYMVGILLMDAGCHEDVVIAGILHDVIEDTSCTEKDIEDKFGKIVLNLVQGSSEPDKSASWEERKKHTISFIEQEATVEVCQIACADKLHNVHSLKQDMKKQGEAVWKHFNRGKDQQRWYYYSLVEALRKKVSGFSLYVQLEKEVAEVFESQRT
ncbi:HD domain-containing protein [Fictibacillus solisalsi]|uniref:HD domain-containing protein n=1 Tax=Fictibacillus solisalsi TaxID=459525 RepID=A0A1G9YCB6_9BACL|nr:HD domain-containing protein [Fictibacillus solisalsi]SDN06195.1 HD domain-containing protein [Fictibacillus solisalsi]